jgi:hypothetical protein
MSTSASCGFGPTVLVGLAELGPVDPTSGDLSLELGLSVWMRRNAISLEDARRSLLALRTHVIEACGLDSATEPVPFVGRSPRLDVMALISYLDQLLRRGASCAGLSIGDLAKRVMAELPVPEASAIGA